MAVLTATFEAGVDGADITTAGGEASATAWDLVNNPSLSTYDNAHTAHGSLAARFEYQGNPYLAWTTAFGTQTDHYGRLYLYMTAYPSGAGAQDIVVMFRDGASDVASFTIHSTGVIRVENAVFGNTSGTVSAALNQWIRVEWHVVNNASTGLVEAKLFNTADATTADDTITLSSTNTGSQTTRVHFGMYPGSTNFTGYTYWLDGIVANATSYPGPVEYTADFEAGVNGATISIADPGSATAWSNVTGGPVYSNTHAAHGTLAAKIDGSTANCFMYWDVPSTDEQYFRFYLYATAFPSVATTFIMESIGGCFLQINSTGNIIVIDGGLSAILTFTNSIALNQWVRIEGHVNTTTEATEVKLFNTADSTTPTETQGTSGTYSGTWTRIYFGTSASFGFSAWGTDIWLDDIVMNATDWVGPADADPAEQPQVLSMLAHVSGHSVW